MSSLASIGGQTRQNVLRFEDFPVVAKFEKRPAEPVIVSNDRTYRTRIREGAQKGPNFAGHYTIVEWECGTGCVVFVVIDAISGRIYRASPFDALSVPYLGTADGRDYKGLDYRLNKFAVDNRRLSGRPSLG
jgi:hypothetical protein